MRTIVKTNGYTDLAQYVGKRAEAEVASGKIVGTITGFEGSRPIVTLPDGRWCYGSVDRIALV